MGSRIVHRQVCFSAGPPPPAPVVVVEGCQGRLLPEAKFSDWARQRRPLESLRAPEDCEVLMAPDGSVLEGCVTNFFVIRGDPAGASDAGPSATLQTSGRGILPGLIRDEILTLCPSLGLSVDMTPPRLEEAEAWQEAFVTSCVRIVQPVSSLRRVRPDGSILGTVRLPAGGGPWAGKISETLRARLRHSVLNGDAFSSKCASADYHT